jgi:phosphocarrier protein FPr
MPERIVIIAGAAGLHARPLAAFVKLAKSFDADVQVENLTAQKGPANGKSPVHLLLLTAQQGHEIRIRTSGPEGEAALDALAHFIATAEQEHADDAH